MKSKPESQGAGSQTIPVHPFSVPLASSKSDKPWGGLGSPEPIESGTTGRARSLANLQRGGIENRRKCEARFRNGRPCRAPAMRGRHTCWQHAYAEGRTW